MRPTRALLVVAVLCCLRPLAAEELHWRTDANKAWATAREEKRPLLLYFTSSGCHWCNEMRTKTFGDPEVAQQVSKSFIAVSVNGESEEDQRLAETLGITAYPAVVVISPDKKILGRINGYVPPLMLRGRLAEPVPTPLQR